MDYKCNKCNALFTRKDKLKYHVNHNSCKKTNFKCTYCDKGFTTKNSMYRHMKHTCKVKKEKDMEKEEIFDRLLKLEKENKKIGEENKKLKKEVRDMRKNGNRIVYKGDIINNNGNMNINNGTINNIALIAYGYEDISKIDKSELIRALQNGYNSTLKLTETVHFNPRYPEYHNVYITNMKDKYAMMYDGSNWTLTMKDDLINKIYDDKKNYIEENLQDFLDSLTPSQKRALDRWANTDEDDKKIRNIKERIKLLLYNLKQMPIDTQNLIEGENNEDIKIVVQGGKIRDTKKGKSRVSGDKR